MIIITRGTRLVFLEYMQLLLLLLQKMISPFAMFCKVQFNFLSSSSYRVAVCDYDGNQTSLWNSIFVNSVVQFVCLLWSHDIIFIIVWQEFKYCFISYFWNQYLRVFLGYQIVVSTFCIAFQILCVVLNSVIVLLLSCILILTLVKIKWYWSESNDFISL